MGVGFLLPLGAALFACIGIRHAVNFQQKRPGSVRATWFGHGTGSNLAGSHSAPAPNAKSDRGNLAILLLVLLAHLTWFWTEGAFFSFGLHSDLDSSGKSDRDELVRRSNTIFLLLTLPSEPDHLAPGFSPGPITGPPAPAATKVAAATGTKPAPKHPDLAAIGAVACYVPHYPEPTAAPTGSTSTARPNAAMLAIGRRPTGLAQPAPKKRKPD